jgi:hypothetical protein
VFCDIATNAVIVLVVDAGNLRWWALRWARTRPVVASIKIQLGACGNCGLTTG